MLQKMQFSPEKYRYLEWPEGRGDKRQKIYINCKKNWTNRCRDRTTHEKSEWREVISGVPQGSVLAPIMFLVYLNDMTEGENSYISLFADDAKKMKSKIHKCKH